MNIDNFKQLLTWVALFLCLLLAQIIIYPTTVESAFIPSSQKNLIRNAAVPIFLSENQAAAIRQLENLIQDTDIQEVRIFSSDQTPMAQVVNSRAHQGNKPNLVESLPVIFQGTLAGTLQIEVVDQTSESSILDMLLPAAAISLFITLGAWLISVLYQLFSPRLIAVASGHTDSRPEVITLDAQSNISKGRSILLYIFPSFESDLEDNTDAKRNIYKGLFQRLEGHLQMYGGRTLSLTPDAMICRMPSGQSSLDNQQALVFAWGASKPLIFKYSGQQFQIQCKTLLHKTQTAAKPGNLFSALTEIDLDTQKYIRTSASGAHITRPMLDELSGSIDFGYIPNKDNPELFTITSINRSLEILWNKQTQTFEH